MKSRLLACIALVFAVTAHAAQQPGIDALRATKLATDFLSKQGAGAPFIVSVTLDEGAIFNGVPSWVVRWSKAIVNDGQTELGVRVKGDGTVVRLVEGKGTRSKRTPAALEIR